LQQARCFWLSRHILPLAGANEFIYLALVPTIRIFSLVLNRWREISAARKAASSSAKRVLHSASNRWTTVLYRPEGYVDW
jgi:hypothetical protein